MTAQGQQPAGRRQKNGRLEPHPAFQFYPQDFLSSDTVALLDNRELGVFIRLLARSWLGPGLPTDPARLARLAGERLEDFEAMWAGPLGDCFFEEAGRCWNRRLEREREDAHGHSERQALRGRFGALKQHGRIPDGLTFEAWMAQTGPDGPEEADSGGAMAAPGHPPGGARQTPGPHPTPPHPSKTPLPPGAPPAEEARPRRRRTAQHRSTIERLQERAAALDGVPAQGASPAPCRTNGARHDREDG